MITTLARYSEKTGIKESVLRRLIRNGMPAFKAGQSWVLHEESVDQWAVEKARNHEHVSTEE